MGALMRLMSINIYIGTYIPTYPASLISIIVDSG